MDLGVKNKTAFITGGGEGIGKLAAMIMAQDGANVVVADQDQTAVEMVADKVKEHGVKSLAFSLDVTKADQVNEAVQKTVEEMGRIDMLIHIPGRGERKPFAKSERADWDFALDLNLFGVLNSAKAVLDQMINQKSGSMAFTVSDAGKVGELNNPIYSAAKGGVIAFSKSLAREMGRYNIRANCVALSAMNTPGGLKLRQVFADRYKSTVESIEKKILANYAIRRFGEPQDAANALCFLVSERASWITGQALSVNGGFSMV